MSKFLCLVAVPLLFALPAVAHTNSPKDCESTLKRDGSRATPEEQAYNVNQDRGLLKIYAAAPPQRIIVSTWNLNLLNMTYGVKGFRVAQVKATFYEERSARLERLLGQYLSEKNPDVLMLQEVWTQLDHQTILRVATRTGYLAVSRNPSSQVKNGLQILIKRSSVESVEQSDFSVFKDFNFTNHHSRASFEWITFVQRGILWAKVKMKNGHQAFFATTHLTPLTDYAQLRSTQIRAAQRILAEKAKGVDHVFFGGDLNIAADYANASPDDLRRLEEARWVYNYFADQTKLRDSFRATTLSNPGYTLNMEFRPLNGVTRSKAHKRLDYLWSGEFSSQAFHHVVESGLAYTERLNENGQISQSGIFPSDHYMVYSVIDLFQLKN